MSTASIPRKEIEVPILFDIKVESDREALIQKVNELVKENFQELGLMDKLDSSRYFMVRCVDFMNGGFSNFNLKFKTSKLINSLVEIAVFLAEKNISTNQEFSITAKIYSYNSEKVLAKLSCINFKDSKINISYLGKEPIVSFWALGFVK